MKNFMLKKKGKIRICLTRNKFPIPCLSKKGGVQIIFLFFQSRLFRQIYLCDGQQLHILNVFRGDCFFKSNSLQKR